MNQKPKILFICGENACRSQMAEGFMRQLYGDKVEPFSAGVRSGEVNPLARQVMAELDIDISEQHSKALDDLPFKEFDCTITLCDDAHREKAALLQPGEIDQPLQRCHSAVFAFMAGIPAQMHWAVADPAQATGDPQAVLETFRRVRDDIKQRIDALVEDGCLNAIMVQRLQSQHLFDMLDDGVVVHDEYRRIFLVNRATLELTGRTKEEIIGMDCHAAFPPDGLCGSHCAFLEPGSSTQDRRDIKITVIRADGERRRVNVKSEPMRIGDQVRGVLAIVRDITELADLHWRLDRRQAFHGMIGVSAKLVNVFDTIRAVAASEYPVLISGESGTGKELAASAIHKESRRAKGPFVPINCGALPENILESELFGHMRGAFTGAIRDKKGRFELAEGGTLFLDEVGELPLHVQVKLLRVLQDQTFERVGGEKLLKANVRIVAATNRNLRQMVQDGEFREDLFYRLCVVPIDLPPLRERKEDIPYLIEQILENIKKETGKTISRVDDGAMGLLFAHHWPGNIRELINALQFASVHALDGSITTDYLPPEIRFRSALEETPPVSTTSSIPAAPLAPVPVNPLPVAEPREGRRTKLTQERVEQALAQAGGNKVKAAKLLGVGRATLYRFFKDNEMKV